MTILPRSAWVDPAMPVVGPAAVPASIVRIAIHYTAAPNLSDGDAGEKAGDIPAYLRAIHRDYTVNRGYSIGYNFAADAYGQAWQLRGLDIKCAANKGMNDTTYAILCLVDGDAPANPPMVAAVREVVSAIFAHLGRTVPIVGHRDIGATACPGAGLYAQVQDRTFVPIPAPPEPKPDPDPDPLPPPLIGDDMLELVASKDHPGPERWVSNGQIRTRPTWDYVLHLQGRGMLRNTSDTPVLLTDAELAGLPLVATA